MMISEQNTHFPEIFHNRMEQLSNEELSTLEKELDLTKDDILSERVLKDNQINNISTMLNVFPDYLYGLTENEELFYTDINRIFYINEEESDEN
ncbi:hypothetical protein [Listeria welshimeri]|uniref:hypothetical protein n=2 Tax=Listeria welshimeri TaxID=1643 RepID=UPI00181EDC46|nr:hypothetical protein [Listeria welshimeri]MBC1639992.1 hypothetical protein [Listeria welshimeri]MBF2353272.1 hypothetical protein [Listeria welshimeri]